MSKKLRSAAKIYGGKFKNKIAEAMIYKRKINNYED